MTEQLSASPTIGGPAPEASTAGVHISVNGLPVYVERWGAGPPLVLLHGFTGSSASWADCAPALASRYAVYAPDLVGHGRTAAPAALTHYRTQAAVADLAALLDALGLATVALLGYSLGGRLALRFALAHPQRVTALILESASPGIADATERAVRRRSDAALADRLERHGLAAFVREWEELPLFQSQRRLPAATRERQRAQRLAGDARGLANSLRGMGAGVDDSVGPALRDLTMPVLLLAGAEDQKYVALARWMATELPNARLAIVPEAGHTIHLEQPELFVRTVGEFLAAPRGADRQAMDIGSSSIRKEGTL